MVTIIALSFLGQSTYGMTAPKNNEQGEEVKIISQNMLYSEPVTKLEKAGVMLVLNDSVARALWEIGGIRLRTTNECDYFYVLKGLEKSESPVESRAGALCVNVEVTDLKLLDRLEKRIEELVLQGYSYWREGDFGKTVRVNKVRVYDIPEDRPEDNIPRYYQIRILPTEVEIKKEPIKKP